MKTEIIKIKGTWRDVVDGCRETVSKPPLGHEPSDEFKEKILIAEHEPIREIEIKWRWRNIAYWIAMHWKTHIWPSRVNTQRDDRTGVNRDDSPQNEPVTFTGRANPQHLIDTFRKRLCFQAHKRTREYAVSLKKRLLRHKMLKQVSGVLVPNCVYRAGCPEIKMCKERVWPEFVKYCREQTGRHPGTMSIHERNAWYNEWLYKCTEAGEK